jgi:CheY-like chemotaxis protein
MPKLAATLSLLTTGVMLAALTGQAAFAADGVRDDNLPASDQARELLAEGVKEYQTGRPDQAALRFQDVLKLEPDNRLLYEFYLAVGDSRLQKMMELDQLDDVLKEILAKARIYQKGLRESAEYINLMISKLEKSEEERVVATSELVAIGPLAVPHLVARMQDNRQDMQRVYCRIALTKMGYRAVVPLTEALNAKDGRLVESVAMILADIGDPRPLPKLKQLAGAAETSDTAKRVIANTVAAIARKTGMDARPVAVAAVDPKNKDQAAAAPAASADTLPADKLFFLEAMRYFRGDARVQDEVVANGSLMWRWNEDEQDTAKKLSYVRVPRYAWNELMAEELLFDAAGHFPQFPAFQPLLAMTLAAQDVEANRRAELATERTTPVENPDESAEAIAERVAALGEMSLRVRAFGPANLYRGIQQAIVSERYDVAVYAMRLLEDKYLADADRLLPSKEEGLTSDKPGTVLVAALDHADKTVRYQAAATLAHLDPSLQFFNSEKVVALLADAVGEWGMRVVVVIDQDYRQRNTAREQLQRQGYLVYTGETGFDLMQRLEESPVKDAIIIAGDLLPQLRDEYGGSIDVPEQKAETLIAKLKSDWRAEKTPVFISLPENPDAAAKIQTAFDGKVAGFVAKPFSGTDLKGKIEAALGEAQLPNVNRKAADDVSLRAARALARPDPARTQFALATAANALAQTLDARADDLRIAALTALGIAANQPKGGEAVRGLIARVTDVYQAQDAQLTPQVRAAFLAAIGQLDPSTEAAVAILGKGLAHEDAAVRTAAADAIGHGAAIAPETLNAYQQQQRIDARAAGAGQAKQ